MIKNKHIITGVIIAVVFAAGIFSVAKAENGILETIKDAIIGLTGKVFELDSRVGNLENATVPDEEALAGISSLDVLDATWVKTGAIASTTGAVYTTHPRLVSYAADGDADDYLRNQTRGNMWVSVDLVAFEGIASSTQTIYVATSSTISLTNYTYSAGVVNANHRQNDAMIHWKVATSTKDFAITSTSTAPLLVRPGEYVVLEVINPYNFCVGGSDTTLKGKLGKCESATSTTRGFDVEAFLTVTGTSTPVFNTNR